MRLVFCFQADNRGLEQIREPRKLMWELLPESGESKAHVLMEVSQFGYQPSDDQLRRWRRLGLLPEPLWRDAYGRGGGSDVYYPVGTASQLIDLLHFRREVRQLEQVGWLLWGRDHPVTTFVRDQLASYFNSVAEWTSKTLAALDTGSPDQTLDPFPLISLPAQFELQLAPGGEGRLLAFIENVSGAAGVALPSGGARVEDLVASLRLIGLGEDRTCEVGSEDQRAALGTVLKLASTEFNCRHLSERARACPAERLVAIREEAQWEWRWLCDVAELGERPFPPMLFVLWFAMREGAGRLSEELGEFLEAGQLKEWQERHRQEYRKVAGRPQTEDDSP